MNTRELKVENKKILRRGTDARKKRKAARYFLSTTGFFKNDVEI